MNEQETKLINETLDYFNFAKVASVMQFLKWQWAYSTSPDRIPVEGELRITVRNHLNSLVVWSEGKEYYMTATGGFHYTAYREEGKLVAIDLKFCVEENQAEILW